MIANLLNCVFKGEKSMKTGISKAIVLGMLLAPMHLLADASASGSENTTASANIGSKNVAPLQMIFPNSYGKAEFRSYTKHDKADEKGNLAHDPYIEPRL